MDSGTACRSPSFQARTRQATRELLEYLITRGSAADLDAADPAWFKNPPTNSDGELEWYHQFGDGSKVMWGRAELLRMVVELHRTSRAPAALALNPDAWFEEWVELPQPSLGFQSPAEVLCTPVGLEAAKVVLRSLQNAACDCASEQCSPQDARLTQGRLRARLRLWR